MSMTTDWLEFVRNLGLVFGQDKEAIGKAMVAAGIGFVKGPARMANDLNGIIPDNETLFLLNQNLKAAKGLPL